MSNVCVIGMGYVGIPMAVLLAHAGHNVIGIQRRSERSGWKIDALNRGECPIANEPDLPEMLKSVRETGNFTVTDDYSAIATADFVLIDVQTPVDASHVPQYNSLRDACREVVRYMKLGAVVIVESTVAPGATLTVVKPILEEFGLVAGVDFGLCFSYERVMVGRLVHNIRTYPKVVGGIDQASTDAVIRLYSYVCQGEIESTDITTAEVAKVAENAYRDVQIAFANEIAIICESLGVDVHEVRKLVNGLPNDPSRPNANPVRNMHFPGAGVGGHCLPKDSWLLLNSVTPAYIDSLIGRARYLNDSMPYHMADLTEDALREAGLVPHLATVCVLGYAFLENSDDDRNSPADDLIRVLESKEIGYVVHDPHVEKEWIESDLDVALRGCDAVVLMVSHDEYKSLTPTKLASLIRAKVVVDGRNVFDQADFTKAGFVFKGVGKGKRYA
jgi:UDP-N-acetyl-D-mannosaminuronic acid dehydrogenase